MGFVCRYLHATTRTLVDSYGGDIPPTVEELVKLKGVGPKMAHITMNVAWGKAMGVGVDVHVHRICNRLGWMKTQHLTPEHTRKVRG